MNIFYNLKPIFYNLKHIEALALVGLILVTLLRRKSTENNKPTAFFRWLLPARRHPWIAFLLVGFLAFATSALLTVCAGFPTPWAEDEVSYLLAADTFAHGRLANPSHPLWKHFETPYVIQHPTYASKYPPGQGLALALGQVIFGHPIVGVWLSVGLACAAICWMLAGWCSLRWAWVGGLLALIGLVFSRPAIFPWSGGYAYWSQSYWGGAVAALGGALVFGALPRIMKKTRWRDAVWLALGFFILANSRPFEGLVVSIPVAVVLGVWIYRTRSVSWHIRFYRLVLPVALILLLGASWMAFYNYRVTGNPFHMPYQVCMSTCEIVPPFLWQPLTAEPHYNNKALRDIFRNDYNTYLKQQTLKGWVHYSIRKIYRFWVFYFGIILTPFILFLAASRKAWCQWNVMFPLGICALMMVALLTETWFFPHYSAPVACLVFLLMVESLRQTRRFAWRGKRIGQQLVRGVLPMLLVSAIASTAVTYHHQHQWNAWSRDMARILWELEHDNERHLVIIRYDSHFHGDLGDVLYNKADIDGAKVVWAWEMDPEADKELLDYFKDRHIWLLLPGRRLPHLISYPGTAFKSWIHPPL